MQPSIITLLIVLCALCGACQREPNSSSDSVDVASSNEVRLESSADPASLGFIEAVDEKSITVRQGPNTENVPRASVEGGVQPAINQLPVAVTRRPDGVFQLERPGFDLVKANAEQTSAAGGWPLNDVVLERIKAQADILDETYASLTFSGSPSTDTQLAAYADGLKASIQNVLRQPPSADVASVQGGPDAAEIAFIASYRFQYASPSSTLKAYEGVLDSSPERYRAVAERSEGVVVVEHNNSRKGSGFLFSPN